MSTVDWIVFAVYFSGVICFAYHHSRKNVGVEGFFLANRRLGWVYIGLSVMATQASAITYIGTTGQAFDDGMEFIQVYLAQPIAMIILCTVFVPFFYRAKIFTAYEYLERRFDSKTRSLTSFLFLMSRGLAAGIVLYAPAIVLSVILGWDETVTILIMGCLYHAGRYHSGDLDRWCSDVDDVWRDWCRTRRSLQFPPSKRRIW